MFDELTHQTGAITMATKRPGMEMICITLVAVIRRRSIFFIRQSLGPWSIAQANVAAGPAIIRNKATGERPCQSDESDTGQLKEICNP